MKKTIIFLLIGSILAGAGLLAGITYGFGAVAEVGVRHAAKQKPSEDATVSWQVDVQDYQRGLFSSETHSKIQVESPAGDIETVDQEGMPFRHVIYHGPLAMTPEGPKFCSYHIVTTLRMDQLDEETQGKLKDAFKGRDPLTIHTTTHFGGSQATRIEVPSFSISDDGAEGSMNFSGATVSLETGPELAYARGQFSIGSLKGAAQGESPMQLEITPSSGTLDFVKDKTLVVKMTSGDISMRSEETRFDMDPSEMEIDWAKSDHLKAHLTVGAIEAGDRNGAGSMVAGPGGLSLDYQRVSDTIDLLLGETKLHLDRVEVDTMGQQVSMQDFVIRADSGEKDGKIYGLINYEIGAIQAPEDPEAPLNFAQIAGKGMEFELGLEGLDLATLESLSENAEQLKNIKAPSDPDDPEEMDAAFEKSHAVFSRMAREMVGLIQPGVDLYLKKRLRGEEGLSLADVRIGMGGDKKLTELGTTREMLMAIEGDANVRISKKQYPPEELQAMMGEGASEFIVDQPDRLEMIAKLSKGELIVNGNPNPLLDDLGPAMDEPFDWDGFIEGMAMGLAASAISQMESDPLMEEEPLPEE